MPEYIFKPTPELAAYGRPARHAHADDLAAALRLIAINGRITGVDLSGYDLNGCNLVGCVFSNCDFVGADLSLARLRGAYLVDCRLDSADLSDTNRGSFFDCSFTGAVLVKNSGNEFANRISGRTKFGSGAFYRGDRVIDVVAQVYRSDGYLFIAFRLADGRVKIAAGCRWLSVTDYRNHIGWAYPNTNIGRETHNILDFVELRVAHA